MSGLFQKKGKLRREPVYWKKEPKLTPGYLILTLWILFTLALLGWVLLASFPTTKKILSNKLLGSGFHIEGHVKAWVNSNVSTIFFNSLLYAAVSCTLLILICASAAYALSRFSFVYNKLMQSSLVASMSVPVIMIVLPLFAVVAGLSILSNASANRATLIFLYIGINMPYTTIFLTTFFANLSRAFEEAAAIDDCPPVGALWLTTPLMAQLGVATVTIFNSINIWNEYFTSLISGNSDKVCPVAVGLYSMINSVKYTGDWADMFSAAVIVFLPTFILYVFLPERIIAGVTGGGMKG